MLKLIYCILVCVFFNAVWSLQIPSYLLEDESYSDVQKDPLKFYKASNDYSSTHAFGISTIGQCVFCNIMPFNKYKSQRNNWSAECSYYTLERCMKYFEIYANKNDAEKTNKHKRFDEIDKIKNDFSVLNQI